MKECHVYLETSLRWPKKGNAIVGIIFTDTADDYSKTIFGQVRDATEHEALLVGLKNALSYLSSFEKINIHTSCGYIAGGINWLPSWRASDWKNSKGEPLKFKDLWEEIAKNVEGKQLSVHLNEFNGYRNWLLNECLNRGRKHGFIL